MKSLSPARPVPAPSGLRSAAAFSPLSDGRYLSQIRTVVPVPGAVSRGESRRGTRPVDRRRSSALADARKRERRLSQNVPAFVDDHGLERCVVLTLTFDHAATQQHVRDARRNLHRYLIRHFLPYITVLAFTRQGRPHLHLLLAARTGTWRGDFNFAAYERRHALVRDAYFQDRPLTPGEKRECEQLRGQLNRTDDLAACWKELSEKLPGFGFGRRYPGDLAPVRDAVALGIYLAKQLGDNLPYVPRGTRSISPVTYPKTGWIPPHGRQFAWNTPSSTEYRRKLAAIGTALGASDDDGGMDHMKEFYGSRWAYHAGVLMEHLAFHHGADPSRWPLEEIRAGAEVTIARSK